MASVLGTPERGDWKACKLDIEEETSMADRFKEQFQSFDLMQSLVQCTAIHFSLHVKPYLETILIFLRRPKKVLPPKSHLIRSLTKRLNVFFSCHVFPFLSFPFLRLFQPSSLTTKEIQSVVDRCVWSSSLGPLRKTLMIDKNWQKLSGTRGF